MKAKNGPFEFVASSDMKNSANIADLINNSTLFFVLNIIVIRKKLTPILIAAKIGLPPKRENR
jgi:hypothetical protein